MIWGDDMVHSETIDKQAGSSSLLVHLGSVRECWPHEKDLPDL